MSKEMRNLINVFKQFKFNESKKYKVVEIEYFHPGNIKSIPNGHPIQKAGFIKECIDNNKKFKTLNYQYLIKEDYEVVEAIHPNQYGLSDYRGGVIIFSTDVNSVDISKNKLLNWFMKKGKTIMQRLFSKSKLNKVINKFNKIENKKLGKDDVDDYIGAFSIGNFFSGRYIGDNNKVFDEKSLSIEINGISTKGLIYVAEEIAREFNQETVLVKDFNKNKNFLVNQLEGDDYNIEFLNKKSD